MEEIPVVVYVSRYSDGSIYREVFPVDTFNRHQRALAGMLVQERNRGPVLGWSAHPGVVEYRTGTPWIEE